LSRYEALLGLTRWAAYANFEDNEKGSIEVGKYADFIILDQDIMKLKSIGFLIPES
jgi:predicted amidohydrolase YtcJ